MAYGMFQKSCKRIVLKGKINYLYKACILFKSIKLFPQSNAHNICIKKCSRFNHKFAFLTYMYVVKGTGIRVWKCKWALFIRSKNRQSNVSIKGTVAKDLLEHPFDFDDRSGFKKPQLVLKCWGRFFDFCHKLLALEVWNTKIYLKFLGSPRISTSFGCMSPIFLNYFLETCRHTVKV